MGFYKAVPDLTYRFGWGEGNVQKGKGMKIFKVNKKISVVCQSHNTRYGFKHTATLIYNGQERGSVKCCYYNRTWERYEYESVLEKLAEEMEALTDREKKLFRKFIENYGKIDAEQTSKTFKTVAMVASLGEIFGQTQKQKNDWKTRMLKTGLEGKGLIMPDDWDTLSEPEKEKRLNGVIASLK